MGHLEVSAHLTVRPGCLEGFKRQAAELIRITKEKDTRTLRYDWFLSTDGTTCEVREAGVRCLCRGVLLAGDWTVGAIGPFELTEYRRFAGL